MKGQAALHYGFRNNIYVGGLELAGGFSLKNDNLII